MKIVYLDEVPAGYSMAAFQGEGVIQVQYRGISLSSNGKDFIRKVEGFPNKILQLACEDFHASDIRNFVAIIHADLKVEAYINELEVFGEALVTKSVKESDPVKKSDLYHFDRISFKDVEFPNDCAYIVILSNGWDRILCYDFGPLRDGENTHLIDYDVGRFLGAGFSASIFYDIFDLDESEWDKVILSGWFPFSYLGYEQQKNLFNHVKFGWNTDDVEKSIDEQFCNDSDAWLEQIASNEKITQHYDIIERSLKYHINKQYDASIHILYPRIEALLREDFIRANPSKEGRRQDVLSEHIPTSITQHTHSVTRLFPEQFGEYILKCYFKDFSVSSVSDFVSRNTLGHGVATISSFTRKSSLVGFLILDQIHRYTDLSRKYELRGVGEINNNN